MANDALFIIDTTATELAASLGTDLPALPPPSDPHPSRPGPSTSAACDPALVIHGSSNASVARPASPAPIRVEARDQPQLTIRVDEAPDNEDKSAAAPKRYWKEPTGISCSICQATDHQARNCDHQLCLTCGAIDEHPTRHCPVSLVCYACGSRGHLSRHCPSAVRLSGAPCARCHSTIHLSLNCPTIWRCYEEETNRKPKPVMRACYNCGDTGDHFGDDCPFGRPHQITEPSAFSSRSHARQEKRSPRASRPRGPEREGFRDDWHSEQNVRRGMALFHDEEPPQWRDKRRGPSHRDRARLARQDDDDDDDWFTNRQHRKSPACQRTASQSREASNSKRIGGSYKGGYSKR